MDRILLHFPATGQETTVATERGARNAEGRGWVRGTATDTPEPDDTEDVDPDEDVNPDF